MAALVPKVLSPQAHRRFDLLALPGILAAAAWMSRRDRPAAALMLMVAAGEGTAMLTTDYPPPVLARWMGLRQHVRAANTHGPSSPRSRSWCPASNPAIAPSCSGSPRCLGC